MYINYTFKKGIFVGEKAADITLTKWPDSLSDTSDLAPPDMTLRREQHRICVNVTQIHNLKSLEAPEKARERQSTKQLI